MHIGGFVFVVSNFGTKVEKKHRMTAVGTQNFQSTIFTSISNPHPRVSFMPITLEGKLKKLTSNRTIEIEKALPPA